MHGPLCRCHHVGSLFSVGVVTLLSDHEVCKEGDVLTPEQARVLVSPHVRPPTPTAVFGL